MRVEPETKTNQEMMEATDLKGNPVEMECESRHQEVPKKEAAVMPVGGLRKQCGDREMAARHCQKPKGRIQARCESLKRLTITCRKMTHRARVAWRKRNMARKDCTRANVVQEIRRGRTFGRRCQLKPECSKGIRSRDVEEPLHLRKGRKTTNSIAGRSTRQQPRLESMGYSNEVFGKTIGLEFRKRTARSSVPL
jgi:hypothetical protein